MNRHHHPSTQGHSTKSPLPHYHHPTTPLRWETSSRACIDCPPGSSCTHHSAFQSSSRSLLEVALRSRCSRSRVGNANHPSPGRRRCKSRCSCYSTYPDTCPRSWSPRWPLRCRYPTNQSSHHHGKGADAPGHGFHHASQPSVHPSGHRPCSQTRLRPTGCGHSRQMRQDARSLTCSGSPNSCARTQGHEYIGAVCAERL